MLGQGSVRFGRRAAQRFTRRNMGGAPPPTEGIDGVVRKYLPGDHHVAMGIIGGYFGLYMVVKLIGAVSGSKEAPKPMAAPTASSSSEIPSIEDPNFATWIEAPGNIDRLVNSL